MKRWIIKLLGLNGTHEARQEEGRAEDALDRATEDLTVISENTQILPRGDRAVRRLAREMKTHDA